MTAVFWPGYEAEELMGHVRPIDDMVRMLEEGR